MAINFHPCRGAILVCDFNMLKTPEITKRRPVIVISPNFTSRNNLCTVVPLSKTAPKRIMHYHHKIFFEPLLPEPFINPFAWVLGDMIYTIGFDRFKLLSDGKDSRGKRIYDARVLDNATMEIVMNCVLHGIGVKS